MKILITGGHLTPALALIEYIQAHTQDEVIFVGREYAQERLKQKSREREEVTKRGVKFLSFRTGKYISLSPFHLFPQSLLFVSSLFRAWWILLRERPDVFMSFGGYMAVPFAFAAQVCGVPIVTHEQTRSVGMANKMIAKRATLIAVSYPETAAEFPAAQAKKIVVTGNPLRQSILKSEPERPSWVPAELKRPILYITGGSQGSQVMNSIVAQILPQITHDFFVIHQCGNPNSLSNYKLELEQRRKALYKDQQENYHVFEWLTETEQSWIYEHARVIVSRSGANTVQELIARAKPAIFIPLQHARADEQLKNAQTVVDKGAALLLQQKDLSAETLLNKIQEFQRHYKDLSWYAKDNRSHCILDADKRLYELVQRTATAATP